MQQYQAYVMAPDGRIQFVAVFRADEASAKDHIAPFIGKHAVELWQGDRMVAAFTQQH